MQQFQFEEIIDFGDLPVFEEATTYPCILSLHKAKPENNFTAATVENLDFDSLLEYLKSISFSSDQEKLSNEGWTLTDERVQNLLEKLRKKGKPLGEYVDGKIYRGVLTGLNEAFVIDEATKNKLIAEDPKSEEVIKPFLAGRNIKRYRKPQSDKHLILFKNGDTSRWFGYTTEEEAWQKLKSKYPAIVQHLTNYEQKARLRYDKGKYWWELRACDYYEEFEKGKLLLPDIAIKAECMFDNDGFYLVNTAYIIPVNDMYLLGIINSHLTHFFYSNLTSSIRGGYLRFIRQYLEQIPIIQIENEAKDCVTKLVGKIMDTKSQNPTADTSAQEAEIDQLVYQLYGLSEEEINIIEDSVSS